MGKVFMEPWAIMPTKLDEIGGLLERHVRGEVDLTEMGVSWDDDDDSGEDTWKGYELHGNVAVVPCHGVIGKRLGWLEMFCGGCDVDVLVSALRAAQEDEQVQAIVIDFDSPGGTITGTPEAADVIEEIANEIPVIAFTETQMCSAAYWLGSSASEVIVARSSIVGSIGVIIAGVDDHKMWDELGLKAQIFKSGELKDTGRRGIKWRDEQKQFLQESVNKTFAEFRGHVLKHRKDVPDEAMTGGWYSGDDIENLALADGFTRDLESLLAEMNAEFDTQQTL
ncbi:MAG: S49 family peptidase [Akkermansiaceae bacterium]